MTSVRSWQTQRRSLPQVGQARSSSGTGIGFSTRRRLEGGGRRTAGCPGRVGPHPDGHRAAGRRTRGRGWPAPARLATAPEACPGRGRAAPWRCARPGSWPPRARASSFSSSSVARHQLGDEREDLILVAAGQELAQHREGPSLSARSPAPWASRCSGSRPRAHKVRPRYTLSSGRWTNSSAPPQRPPAPSRWVPPRRCARGRLGQTLEQHRQFVGVDFHPRRLGRHPLGKRAIDPSPSACARS
jgi:hypothetical protein